MDPMAEPTALAAEPASAGEGAREDRLLTSDDSESNHPRCTTSEVDSPPGSDLSGDLSAAARCTGASGSSAARLAGRSDCVWTWRRRPTARVWPSLVGPSGGCGAAWVRSCENGDTAGTPSGRSGDAGNTVSLRSARTGGASRSGDSVRCSVRAAAGGSIERCRVVGRSGRAPSSGAIVTPFPPTGEAHNSPAARPGEDHNSPPTGAGEDHNSLPTGAGEARNSRPRGAGEAHNSPAPRAGEGRVGGSADVSTPSGDGSGWEAR